MLEKSQEHAISDYYDSQINQYDSGYSEPICQAEDKVVADILRSIIRGRTLDVGCGTGLFLTMLNPDQYLGLEISGKMAEHAKLKYPQSQFLQANQEQIPVKDHSFDSLVSLYGPFSYSLSPEDTLNEFRSVKYPFW